MTALTQRQQVAGLYVAVAAASIVALVLVALLAWLRGPSLAPHRQTSFETDSPP